MIAGELGERVKQIDGTLCTVDELVERVRLIDRHCVIDMCLHLAVGFVFGFLSALGVLGATVGWW